MEPTVQLGKRTRVAWYCLCAGALLAACSTKPDNSTNNAAMPGVAAPAADSGQTTAMTSSAGDKPASSTMTGTAGASTALAGTPASASGHAGASGGTSVAAGSGGASAGQGGATAAGEGGAGTAASGSGGAPATVPAAVADFASMGPYGKGMRLTNQGKGTIRGGTQGTIGEGGDDASAFTIWFPTQVMSGEHFPLLTWGNGTFCSPTLYDELMYFIVSYGYVVVATNTSNAGTGKEMLQAVDWALAENDKADSPLFGLIDGDHIGAFGHSQGGEGAVNTGADARIKALAPLSAGPMGSGEAKIQCPTFYTLTADDVVTPDSYRASYDATKAPSAYGVMSGGNHMEYADKADFSGAGNLSSNDAQMSRSAITAWFEWQLKSKPALQPLFVGKDCGFCKDKNWKILESKGF